jgi:hypothetical protein
MTVAAPTRLQLSLIRSHAAGAGEPVEREVVRATSRPDTRPGQLGQIYDNLGLDERRNKPVMCCLSSSGTRVMLCPGPKGRSLRS